MEITIPGAVQEIPFARIHCRGKVIRVDRHMKPKPDRVRFGVAATIERLRDVNVESMPKPAGHSSGEAIA